MMRFTKKEGRAISAAIQKWEQDGEIDSGLARRLRESYTVREYDWRRVARYSFLVAALCAVIGAGAAMADEALLELMTENAEAVSPLFGVLSGVVFYFGHRRGKRRPELVFENDAIVFCGALLAAAAFTILDWTLEGKTSLLFLAAAVFYGGVGAALRAKSVWVFSLLSLGSWLGMETGYVAGSGAYYLGLNYPLRALAFGAGLIGLSFFGTRFGRVTFIVGMLYLFTALWILSIFGDDDFRGGGRGADLLFWSVVFGAAGLAAIGYGVKREDAASRGFGLTFFLINLYTKYFEYFWDEMHKAVFFFLLAVSFWLVGRKAEAVWGFLRRKAKE